MERDKIREWTRDQLLQEVHRMRKQNELANPNSAFEPIGQELFIDTEAGSVRALLYNAEDERTLPLYVNLHGGGFIFGSAEMDDPFMANIAKKADIKVLNIDYSLAPEFPFPQAVNECFSVIEYAKANADEFGIDPDKIALGGQSAGGNIAIAVTLMDNGKQALGLKALALNYPVTDLHKDPAEKPDSQDAIPAPMSLLFNISYCMNAEERKSPMLSPVYASEDQIDAFPPTVMITAARDTYCEEAEKFRDKLIEAGVFVTHRRFDAPHAFNTKNTGTDTDESWQMIIDHLKENLK